MYYLLAVFAYLMTMDYIGGGDLGSKLGYTTEEAAKEMYKLFKKEPKNEQ